MFLVVGLRFFHLGGVKRRATHVVQDRTDTIDRRKIIRMRLENGHEFGLGLVAIANIFRGRRARNVLRRVCGRQIQASIQQLRIKLGGLLEILDGRIRLAALVGLHAFVEFVARAKFVAAGGRDERNHDDGEKKNCLALPLHSLLSLERHYLSLAGRLAVIRPTLSIPAPRRMSTARATCTNSTASSPWTKATFSARRLKISSRREPKSFHDTLS